MRRWTRYMLLVPVLAIVQALSSCSTIDGPEDDGKSPVEASLAFTVSSAAGATTRMDNDVVQEQPENGRSYRGLGEVYPIPFAITGTQITSSDHSSRLLQQASLIDSHDPQTGNYGGFYLYNAYTINRGINAFLVYGKASKANMQVPSGVSDKAYFGKLLFPDLLYPDIATLRFSPEPIYQGTAAPAAASTLAGYLSNIANTPGWSTTTDATLKLLYKVFTGQENDGNVMVMAGASVNVMALANSLYALMSQLTFTGSEATIQTEILNRIKSYTAEGLTLTNNSQVGTAWRLTAVKVDGKDYPSSLNLPDGAAALRWEKISETEYGFIPQTVTTTLANINNINRWCYPPELFYYANSRIDTSNKEVENSVYTSATDWDGNNGVLSKYENKNAVVSGNTKGIAIQKPLEYAVGRLKMTLQELAVDKLNDDAGKAIPVKNASNNPSFPLTGIIICNQHPVGYDFKPVLVNGAVTHSDDHFIYDSQVGTDCCLRQATTETLQEIPIPSTLVLQTYGDETVSGEEVVIALEFRNDSGEDFRGKSGIIYQGTKFYLMGVITPVDGTANSNVPADVLKRVFTRDYITTVSTKVESLANAYNVLPNILGGRLELGVELNPNWIQAETTNVILE